MRPTRWSAQVAGLLVAVLASVASGTSVKDICRIRGQGSSVLQGLGLVVGLNGTGDSGEELVVARPLAKVLENHGQPIGDFEELANSQSVALVMVQARTPKGGAQVDDRFDVSVSVLNSATSLEGGELYLTPMTGPYPGSEVYAIASGAVAIPDGGVPTRGRVRGGAQITRPITPAPVGESFELVLEPSFAGYQSAVHVASRIRDEYLLRPSGREATDQPVAEAVDDRTVRVTIPERERARKASFIADLLSTEVDPSQMKLPARVIVNRDTGAIVVTGDVEISLVAVSHENLVIRRVTPPPEPTPQNPQVENEKVVGVGTRGRDRERAALDDLLEAFKQLDVEVADQIEVLQMLHKSGRLHAELVVD